MINPCFPRRIRGARPARGPGAGSLRWGAPGAGPRGNAEVATRGSGRPPPGLLPSSLPPSLVAFFFFFSLLLSLPLPFLFVKGGGRQRRAGVSGRGLEFHLNDCPGAHAAPRSRPACAPQPSPVPGRPARGRPRRGSGPAGSPRPPRPDLAALGAAALASSDPRTPVPARRRRSREGARAPSAVGRAPMSAAGPSAGRGPPLP